MSQLEPIEQYGTSVFDLTTRELLLRFDCNINEKYSRDADVSAFPVESGFTVTDNHQARQRFFELTGEITNTPLDGDTTEQRARRAFVVLDELCTSGRRISITAGLYNYENCVIRSYTVPRDSKTAQTMRATVNFVQIETVNSESVEVPADVLAALKRASGKSKTSKTDKDKPPSAKQDNGRKKSLAKRAANVVADLELF